MTSLIDWKVMEVVPAMLKAIEYSDLHEDVVDEDEIIDEFTAYDAISGYIEMLDENFAETLLQSAETVTDNALLMSVTFRLAQLLPQDRRVFDLVTRRIERAENMWDKTSLADALLELKIPEKTRWLKDYAKRKEHPQKLKMMLRNRIKAAK
ncbi:MAG: hypothetical protein K8I82_19465, partial [Anaerolineae bacterium]|nr:hypothetical protein [Anaerolineae bacterium]